MGVTRKTAALLSLSAALAQAQTCDVLDLGNPPVELATIVSGFSGADFKLLPFSSISGGALRIADESGAISGAWLENPQRLSDGFQATFTFELDGGTTDGVAFVVQNSANEITDTLSIGGSALGFRDGIDRLLAVAFDFCNDRGDETCNEARVRLDVTAAGDAVSNEVTSVVIDDTANFNGQNTVVVSYVRETGEITVDFNGNRVIDALGFGESLESLFGGKFGFIGFTGSNIEVVGTDLSPATQVVTNFDVVQFNSDFRFDDNELERLVVDFGTTVTFTLRRVDTCNNQLANDDGFDSDAFAETIACILDPNVDRDPVVGIISTTENSAEYLVQFTTPVGVEAVWDLSCQVDAVFVQKNPAAAVVDTEIPGNGGGLSALGIGLLSALIALLVIGVIVIIFGVRKYKKKLKEHKEDIDYGKTKKKMDNIEKTITFNPNPMIAPIEKLRDQLEKNDKRIAALKAGQADAIDSDKLLADLQDENTALRKEMQELKKKQEFADAGAGNRRSIKQKFFGRGGDKKDKLDFDQDGA